MNAATFSLDASDSVSIDSDTFTLQFISDVEYEFVGGGTAVNSL